MQCQLTISCLKYINFMQRSSDQLKTQIVMLTLSVTCQIQWPDWVYASFAQPDVWLVLHDLLLPTYRDIIKNYVRKTMSKFVGILNEFDSCIDNNSSCPGYDALARAAINIPTLSIQKVNGIAHQNKTENHLLNVILFQTYDFIYLVPCYC